MTNLDLTSGTPVWTAYRAPLVPTMPLTRDARIAAELVLTELSGSVDSDAELFAFGR